MINDKTFSPGNDGVLGFKSQIMGLRTHQDVKVAFVRQASIWWQGSLYYCPLCDEEFHEAAVAARHLIAHRHPVLRWEQMAWPAI